MLRGEIESRILREQPDAADDIQAVDDLRGDARRCKDLAAIAVESAGPRERNSPFDASVFPLIATVKNEGYSEMELRKRRSVSPAERIAEIRDDGLELN